MQGTGHNLGHFKHHKAFGKGNRSSSLSFLSFSEC